MSDNWNTTPQPTNRPSHSRSRFDPDPAGMPSLRIRGNTYNPLLVNQSSARVRPLLPPVSLSHGERLQHILPQRAASQPSSHLQPGSNPFCNTSAASHPSGHLLPISTQPSNTSSASQPSNNLNAWVTLSSGPSLKRDFSSAFEGLEPSFRQSMERALDPRNSWFPDVPEDAGNRFLMQQSDEDVEYMYRVLALRARLSRDAMLTRETRAKKAEEQARSLFGQLGSLKAEMQSREQTVSFQLNIMRSSLEEERKLRKQADQALEAAVKRVKDLEGKLGAAELELEQAHSDSLEQSRTDVENSMSVNMGLEDNVNVPRQNLLGDPFWNPAPVEQEPELRQGHAGMDHLQGDVDVPEEHSLGNGVWNPDDFSWDD